MIFNEKQTLFIYFKLSTNFNCHHQEIIKKETFTSVAFINRPLSSSDEMTLNKLR